MKAHGGTGSVQMKGGGCVPNGMGPGRRSRVDSHTGGCTDS